MLICSLICVLVFAGIALLKMVKYARINSSIKLSSKREISVPSSSSTRSPHLGPDPLAHADIYLRHPSVTLLSLVATAVYSALIKSGRTAASGFGSMSHSVLSTCSELFAPHLASTAHLPPLLSAAKPSWQPLFYRGYPGPVST